MKEFPITGEETKTINKLIKKNLVTKKDNEYIKMFEFPDWERSQRLEYLTLMQNPEIEKIKPQNLESKVRVPKGMQEDPHTVKFGSFRVNAFGEEQGFISF